jgi:hypothetical protein
MKKKNLKEINEIIANLTDLESELAVESHYKKFANQDKILEWFGKLHNVTSRLDNFYKKEIGTK